MVDFAGWRMPVQYEGIRQEHMAVREKVGIFDVSHMGQIRTSGPEAAKLLQRLLSSDVEKLQIGAAQYGLICREDGGIIDDLFTYRLGPDEFLTVTNAANHGKDLAWFRRHRSGFDATVTDAAIDYAMIAVQGPGAAFALQALSSSPLPERLHCAAAQWPQRRCWCVNRVHRRGRLRVAHRPRRRRAGMARTGRAGRGALRPRSP